MVGDRFLLLVGVGEGPEGELHGELKRGGNGAAPAVAPAFWLGGGKERAVWQPWEVEWVVVKLLRGGQGWSPSGGGSSPARSSGGTAMAVATLGARVQGPSSASYRRTREGRWCWGACAAGGSSGASRCGRRVQRAR